MATRMRSVTRFAQDGRADANEPTLWTSACRPSRMRAMAEAPLVESFLAADGIRLVYDRWPGNGTPIVLHHGFAADSRANWITPGIVDVLRVDGRPIISVDARGHGRSDKPHEPDAYGHAVMSRDLSTLFDHLGVEIVDLVGYSMGGYVSAITAARREPRLRSVVLGGIGAQALGATPLNRTEMAAAMLVEDPKTISDRTARQFRRFAEASGADRKALAAILRSPWHPVDGLSGIGVPALVLVGADDDLAANPEKLASAIPNARLVITAGDHLGAVGKAEYAVALRSFLREQEGVAGG